jgi:hypothetical protein
MDRRAFNEHAVIDFAAQRQRIVQFGFLRFCRVKPIFYAKRSHTYIMPHFRIMYLQSDFAAKIASEDDGQFIPTGEPWRFSCLLSL